jgi:hypothetical protein
MIDAVEREKREWRITAWEAVHGQLVDARYQGSQYR